jgi:ABC-2 type transport system ATP-binding protein
VDDVLSLVDLEVKRESLIEALSRGMQQRLGIARVLIHDPELLILDEPASGLDPRARIEIRSLLQELQKMGKTILISSHILADLGEVCNRVGIIEKGRLLVDGSLDDVVKKVRPSGVVRVLVGDVAAAETVLKSLPCVRGIVVQRDCLVVTMSDHSPDTWRIPEALVKADIKVLQMEPESDGLERAFIELTEGTVS